MVNPAKIFKKAIDYDGERCDVHHVNSENFDQIPDILKTKAYGVCFHNGKIVLVNHSEWDIWSIPGGTRDPGETIEEALYREVLEETNCKILNSIPIAYQKVVAPSNEICHFRLLYMCNVVPYGEFNNDPAGSVKK